MLLPENTCEIPKPHCSTRHFTLNSIPPQQCVVHAGEHAITIVSLFFIVSAITASLNVATHTSVPLHMIAVMTLSLCCFKMWQADNQIIGNVDVIPYTPSQYQ